jgi:biotin carboxylase
VILKPRALTGSYGVVKVESAAQLGEAFGHVKETRLAGAPAYASDVLVEEYADGPEISIDAVCTGGEVTPLFVARKRLGFPPYFEEVGHIVDAADPLLPAVELRRMLAAAHAAVGLITGWTHTEIRLSSRGPRLVEINARIGGDMIPYLGRLATGIDPGLTAAAVACSMSPAISPVATSPAGLSGVDLSPVGLSPVGFPADRRTAAGIAFLYPPHDMVTAGITVDELRLPSQVDTVRLLAVPGQEVRLPPRGHISGRFAFVIVAGPSAASCAHALSRAAEAITIRGAAIAAVTPS